MRTLLIAVLVGVIASAGSATAASVITGKQIRNGTITGADVKNRSISGKDLKRGSVNTARMSVAAVQELQAVAATTQVVESQPVVMTPDGKDYGPKQVVAYCPDGQIALGGGGGPTKGEIQINRPVLEDGKAVGWTTGGIPSTADGAVRMEVFIICSP